MKMSPLHQTLRKAGLFLTLLVVSSLSSPGSDLIPVIDPDPLVTTALETLAARHPEIQANDLKLASIECVYAFNNDFDPREKSVARSESKKGANAVLTFAVLSTRQDSSDEKTRSAEYDAWKVVVAAGETSADTPVEKTRVVFTSGKGN